MARRIIRRLEVERRTGISRSTIYAEMAAGKFPKPVPLGPGSVGWLEDEVEAWIVARIAERDRPKPNRREAAHG